MTEKTITLAPAEPQRINLRNLGFVGRVSDEARAEIEADERRAASMATSLLRARR